MASLQDLASKIKGIFTQKKELISPVGPTPTPDTFAQKGWEKTGANSYRWPTQTVTPTATPTPAFQAPYGKEISTAWGKDAEIAHNILRYTDPQTGEVKGENTNYRAGPEVDIPNRIDPKTGQWSSTAPVKTFVNPFSGQSEQSIDRGLFRINNETFYDFQRRFPQLLKQNGINNWDEMLDPLKNSLMAKIIFDIQKQAWYAANQSTGARIQ